MGCLLSESKDENSGEDIYLRACSERSSYGCADYEGDEGGDYHECVCQGEGCNKDWTTAGDTADGTTTDNPVINVRSFEIDNIYLPNVQQCYVCKTEPGAAPCNAENPGPIESCPPENTVGCLISQTTDQNSGENLYTRSCTDHSPYECRDFQGDEDGEYVHECVCQGDGCNLNWSDAGEKTTPDGMEKSVSFDNILNRII